EQRASLLRQQPFRNQIRCHQPQTPSRMMRRPRRIQVPRRRDPAGMTPLSEIVGGYASATPVTPRALPTSPGANCLPAAAAAALAIAYGLAVGAAASALRVAADA